MLDNRLQATRYRETRNSRVPVTTEQIESGPAAGRRPDLPRMLSNNKRLFAVAAIAGALAGVLSCLVEAPRYEARTSLEIQSINRDFMNMREFDPTSEGYSAESYMQTQLTILQSKSLVHRVTDKLNVGNALAERKVPTSFSWLLATFGIKAHSWTEPAVSTAIREASKSLLVRSSGLSQIVGISCESTHPQMAADFVNTLAKEYIQQNMQARWNASQQTSEWLMRQMQNMKQKVEESEAKLFAKAGESGNLFSADRDNLIEDQQKRMEEELFRAQADRMQKQARYDLAKASPLDALPEVLDDPVLKDQRSSLANLNRDLANLTPSLTPSHPRVLRLESQIADVERSIERENSRMFERLANEYNSAARRETLLRAAELNQAHTVSAQAVQAVEYNLAKHEAEANRRIYDGLLQRVKETGIAAAIPTVTVRVVDVATLPDRPISPRFGVHVAAGIMAGLFLCFVFAAGKERFDHSLRSPEDLASLNVPKLGFIPLQTLKSPLSGERGIVCLGRGSLPANVELSAWHGAPSLMADSFNATFASLLFSRQSVTKGQILVVTSPGAQEGKTLVCVNLAIACANLGHRVLLVDGDLRRPRMHEIFDAPNEHGFSDLLRTDELDATPPDMIVRSTGIKGLSILPSGTVDGRLVQLLYSRRSLRLVAWFRKHFDTVFIDSPPMLALPDARLLGRQSDGVVITICSGKTTKDEAAAALARLAEDDILVVGAVLNKWDPDRNGSLYGQYYAAKRG